MANKIYDALTQQLLQTTQCQKVCMRRLCLFLLLLLSFAFIAQADSVLNMHDLFSGRNIYAPTLINDGIYKLWYGGWQTQADFPKDNIYYRISPDNLNWSNPTTVLRPAQISSQAVHVNDPSVTKHLNKANSSWQYTMFYTVCVNPCNQSDNQIWSSVSSDGIDWHHHQMLLAGAPGPAEPSAIIDPQPDGTFWKVYYVDRHDAIKVKLARVNGNRNALSVQTVYVYTGQSSISGSEVRQINGQWHLFFNAFFPDRVDICKTESSSNESWPSHFEVLIQNSGLSFCGTLTPGMLAAGGDQYDLYFGLTPRAFTGSCDLTRHESIHRWRWVD